VIPPSPEERLHMMSDAELEAEYQRVVVNAPKSVG
jgi:hypothetical protein